MYIDQKNSQDLIIIYTSKISLVRYQLYILFIGGLYIYFY